MHIDRQDRVVICKICYYGPALAGKGEMLRGLYSHFSARDGEHSDYQFVMIQEREVLEETLGPIEAKATIEATEAAMGAPYDDLVDAGTLLWFRTRLSAARGPDDYDIVARAVTVSGPAWHDGLRRFSLLGADVVIFVADTREERIDATIESWENLRFSGWNGAIILVTTGEGRAEEMAAKLEFEGPTYSSHEGFERSIEAFAAATKLALETLPAIR